MMNDHPDIESLSTFLDGQAPEVEGHVAGCAECRRRLDGLARVRAAIAAPVPPPDQHRKEVAIAEALGAASTAAPTRDGSRWRLVAVAGGVAAALLIGVVISRVSTSTKSARTASGRVAANVIRAGDLG